MAEDFAHIDAFLRNYVHLNDEELENYIAGTLNPQLREIVIKHLRLCFYCRTEVGIVKKVLGGSEIGHGEESDDVVTQEITNAQSKAECVDMRFWLNDNSYRLRATEADPTLLEIEDLVLADLLVAREEDLHDPGRHTIGIEGAGQPLLIPLAKFLDVQHAPGAGADSGTPIQEYPLVAKRFSPRRTLRPSKRQGYVPRLHCTIDGRIIEILSDASWTVFLRLSGGK